MSRSITGAASRCRDDSRPNSESDAVSFSVSSVVFLSFSENVLLLLRFSDNCQSLLLRPSRLSPGLTSTTSTSPPPPFSSPSSNGMTAAGARAGLENSAWMHSGRPRERATERGRGHAKAVRSVGGCRRTGGRCSRSQSLSPPLSLVWRLQGVRASRLLHFMNQIIFAS